MKQTTINMVDELIETYPRLAHLEETLIKTIEDVLERIKKGGKILVCGNGGSASDSEHIVGELVKEFYIKRPIDKDFREKLNDLYDDEGEDISDWLQEGIKAISLVSQTGLISAYANDVNPQMAYAQQVYVYGNSNDILIGISTSGNSENIVYAAKVAKAKGMYTINLTGKTGGRLKEYSDSLLNAPEVETYKVQEFHLPIYHLICRALENEMYGDN